MKKKLNIAIDGPAGSGKSTIAKSVAKELGYTYFDTGALYRFITYEAMQRGIVFSEEEKIAELVHQLNFNKIPEAKIRQNDISKNVSFVAKIPAVRHNLIPIQRAAAELGGVVMEGRDIGSAILPDAEVKIFLTASVEARAQRRYKELLEKGYGGTLENIKKEIMRRDEIDSGREINPLVKVEDAIDLDTSDMDIQEVVAAVVSIVKKYL